MAFKHTVSFKENEHIIEINATFSKNAIHSISGVTNIGKLFSAEGFDGYGKHFKNINFYR